MKYFYRSSGTSICNFGVCQSKQTISQHTESRRFRSSNIRHTYIRLFVLANDARLIRKRNKVRKPVRGRCPRCNHELPRSLKLQRLLKNTIARCIFHSLADACAPPPSSRLPLPFCSCSFCALASASADKASSHGIDLVKREHLTRHGCVHRYGTLPGEELGLYFLFVVKNWRVRNSPKVKLVFE